MAEVTVIAEGQTEEQFIKRVVAPALRCSNVFVKPILLKTSLDAKGGAITFDRLKLHARNCLRQNGHTYVTTFLDLYGLDSSFPKFHETKSLTPLESRLFALETALHSEIIAIAKCRAEMFIPYIQPHEFEGLLFSDAERLSSVESNWQQNASVLLGIRSSYPTPEHINDGYQTKPSKRLEILQQPTFRKTVHGPLAAEKITLTVIEAECPHFQSWMNRLRSL